MSFQAIKQQMKEKVSALKRKFHQAREALSERRHGLKQEKEKNEDEGDASSTKGIVDGQ